MNVGNRLFTFPLHFCVSPVSYTLVSLPIKLNISKSFNFLYLWQLFVFCTLFQIMYIFLELQHTELKTKLLQTLYWCWMQQKDYFIGFGIISYIHPWFLLTKCCLVVIWRGKPVWFGVLVWFFLASWKILWHL